jgi:uncharacterized membrane protein
MKGDAHLEERLGRILRVGVHASTACLAVGLIWSVIGYSGGAATAVMTAGLVLLLATPVARVAASIVEYAVQRDWTFVALTSIVFLELCVGIVAALVFHRRS